ncbi:MAG: cytochrome c [Actinomycetota bacterium]
MAGTVWRRAAPVAVISLALAACVAGPPEVTIDDPVLIEGRDIYARVCASCHGPAGDGGVGLKLSDGAAVAAFPDIEDQIALVAEGRNNMPAYGDRLTPEQQRAVVRYIREIL